MTRRLIDRPAVRLLAGLLTMAILLAVWEQAGRSGSVTFLPPVSEVAREAWTILSGPELTNSVLPSVGRALAGYLIGGVAGCLCGVLLGYFRRLEPWLRPSLEFLRAIPLPVVLPIAVAAMGGTNTMRISLIVAGAFWPVVLNAEQGTRSVDPRLIDSARMSGTSTIEVLRLVVWPATLPFIFAGLRTALGISLVLMVVSEMIASTSGLGYLVLQSQRLYAMSQMFAGVVILGLLGYGLSLLLNVVERRTISWYHQQKGLAYV